MADLVVSAHEPGRLSHAFPFSGRRRWELWRAEGCSEETEEDVVG